MSETNIPSEIEVEDLQKQVRNHIKEDLFDWDEALTAEEMLFLEQLLLTFAPMFRAGSIGFAKSVQPYITQQASTIAALQAEKEETKKDFYWQGVEISELKAENERLKRLIDGPPHLQKIWDDFMKENNL